MKNFIEGYVNALTSEECAKIISYMNEDGRLGPGRVKDCLLYTSDAADEE